MRSRQALKLDKDGKLGVSEAEAQQTCIRFAATYGYKWVKTNASDLTRSGWPAHSASTLDGLLIRPHHVIVVEWKRRMAKTDKERLAAQAEAEADWVRRGYDVIRMLESHYDPIRWFKDQFMQVLVQRKTS